MKRGTPPPRRGRARLAAALLLLAAACAEPPPDRSHVVFVVIDTLRHDAVFDPDVSPPTPHLDRLAEDGVVFSRAFSHAPMTLPSHTAMFSSQIPAESGVFCNSQDVPEDLPLLAEHMSDQGYRTVGVISLGTLRRTPSSPGLSRGFDEYDLEFWDLDIAENVSVRIRDQLAEYVNSVPLVSNASPGSDAEEEGSTPVAEPLFLFAHYSDPHSPYRAHQDTGKLAVIELDGRELIRVPTSDAPQWSTELELAPGEHELVITSEDPMRMRRVDLRGKRGLIPLEWTEGAAFTTGNRFVAHFTIDEKTRREDGLYPMKVWLNDQGRLGEWVRRYAAEVEHVDHFIGELIRDLEEHGLYEDALVVLVSDHGEAFKEHGHIGHVRTLYDEQIHVPLIIKPPKGVAWAERLENNREEVVSLIDLVPTILQGCGLPAMPGQRGRSLLAADLPRVPHVAETHKPEAPVDIVSMRDETYKLIYVVDTDSFEMYDLEKDPKERNDRFEELVSERPDWPDRLKTIARASAARSTGEVTAEQEEMLRALGYIGSE